MSLALPPRSAGPPKMRVRSSGGPPLPHGGRRSHEGLLVVASGLVAGLGALALAPLGMTGVYVLAGGVTLGVVAYGLRADLVPPLREAVDRVRPRRWRAGAADLPRWLRVSGSLAVAVVCAGLAYVMASFGSKGLVGLAGACVLVAAVWLLWPLIRDLLTAEPSDIPARTARHRSTTVVERRPSRMVSAVGVGTIVVGIAMLSFVLGTLGKKGILALVGAVGVGALMVYVRDRSVFFSFAATCSLAVMLHKSFSSQDLELSGGAISVYVTTFDAMLLVLYGLWAWEGTLVADVKEAIRRPIIWLPLACALLLLPSLLVAPSAEHSAAELFRMTWMYLLYFYLAVRVRTRRHVWAVLGGLAVFVMLELVVVVLQWKTGGVLGLSFLGVPTHLTQRVTDQGDLGRPFGTIIHPVFMGAVMGSLALVAQGLAIELKRSLAKIAACALILCCFFPLYLAHTRASLVAALAAALAMLIAGIARGRVGWRVVGRLCLAAIVGVVVFFPELATKYSENFGTSHFYLELRSRFQLNHIALAMIHDHWALGVGLNNFELVMPKYEPYRVIFFNNPVHNLYLLYLAECGFLGLVAISVVGVALMVAAIRLARSTDRLAAGVGLGVAGAMGFLMVEELLGFSLRQDTPLAVYWLLAGLVVACLRIAPPAPRGRRTGSTRVSRAAPVGGRRLSPPPGEGTANAVRRFWPGTLRRSGSARVMRWSWRPARIARACRRWPNAHAVRERLACLRAARRRPAFARRMATLGLLPVTVFGGLVTAGPLMAAGDTGSAVRLVFGARIRATGEDAIFTANADGSGVRRISPADGRTYSWPRWAFGGTKIVYSARRGGRGSAERIELMNPDGSGRRLIQSFEYAVGQPAVDNTGTYLTFVAVTPWFPNYGIFRMDLRTGLSRNLSGVTRPLGAGDSDPALVPGGKQIAFVAAGPRNASITTMNVDGTHRVPLTTHGDYFDTDPDVSPDGNRIVTASYRGPATPQDEQKLKGKTQDFHIVTFNRWTGAERVLTAGRNCVLRSPTTPCAIPEMSGYTPRYSPDGSQVAFTGALDRTTTCICAVRTNGSQPHVIVSSTTLAINWFDWRRPSPRPPSSAVIGSHRVTSRVLLTVLTSKGRQEIVDASADLMHRTTIWLPKRLRPIQARWTPDRRQIVVVADVPVPKAQGAPHPAPPPGKHRREHVTLDDSSPLATALRAGTPSPQSRLAARHQVFLRRADGTLKRLTDPWTEDWRDGVRLGDARGNTDPVVTPDGRAVIVTNTSTLTGESFLLRIDLRTGAVLNLTNGTSGAMAVDDSLPAVSPDGRRVAFSWLRDGRRDLYLMDAATGYDVRGVTADGLPGTSPAWLPDRSGIVYVGQRDGHDVILRVDVGGLEGQPASHALSSRAQAPAANPVVRPSGGSVLFVGRAPTTRSVYVADPRGAMKPWLLQPDPQNNVLFLDWR